MKSRKILPILLKYFPFVFPSLALRFYSEVLMAVFDVLMGELCCDYDPLDPGSCGSQEEPHPPRPAPKEETTP